MVEPTQHAGLEPTNFIIVDRIKLEDEFPIQSGPGQIIDPLFVDQRKSSPKPVDDDVCPIPTSKRIKREDGDYSAIVIENGGDVVSTVKSEDHTEFEEDGNVETDVNFVNIKEEMNGDTEDSLPYVGEVTDQGVSQLVNDPSTSDGAVEEQTLPKLSQPRKLDKQVTNKNGQPIKMVPRETLFECELCDHKFSKRRHLMEHVRSHNGDRPFSCTECDYKSSRKSDLNYHIKTHTGDKPHKCHLCQYKCIKKCYLKQHIATHTGHKPYVCDICAYKCSRKHDLSRHIETHIRVKTFACHLCEYKCINSSLLNQHFKIHTGEKQHKCHLCNKKFARRSHLCRHVRTHSGAKPFRCHVCDNKYTRNEDLKRHLRTHLPPGTADSASEPLDTRLDGTLIDGYYASQEAKDGNARLQGVDDGIYYPIVSMGCDTEQLQDPTKQSSDIIVDPTSVQDKDTTDPDKNNSLSRHQPNHTGDQSADTTTTKVQKRRFECHLCTLTFTRKSNLNCHLRIHSGEKPFSCNMCDFRFIKKCDLNNHIKTHTGDKPYHCDVCDYKCVKKSYLKQHVAIHTGEKPYVCHLCSYSCVRKHDLARHVETHDEARSFPCQTCEATFTRRSDLIRHSVIHTAKKLFPCRQCNNVYVRNGDLLKHTKCHFRVPRNDGLMPPLDDSTEEVLPLDEVQLEDGLPPEEDDDIYYPIVTMEYESDDAVTGLKFSSTSEPACTEEDVPAKDDDDGQPLLSATVGDLGSTDKTINTIDQVKQFKCDTCSLRFTRKSNLKEHLKLHTGEKPFVCQSCDFSFSRRSDLKYHIRIHTGEKPFQCNLCEYKCIKKSYLRLHTATHTGEKHHQCGLCAYKCFRKGDLLRHHETHVKNKEHR